MLNFVGKAIWGFKIPAFLLKIHLLVKEFEVDLIKIQNLQRGNFTRFFAENTHFIETIKLDC